MGNQIYMHKNPILRITWRAITPILILLLALEFSTELVILIQKLYNEFSETSGISPSHVLRQDAIQELSIYLIYGIVCLYVLIPMWRKEQSNNLIYRSKNNWAGTTFATIIMSLGYSLLVSLLITISDFYFHFVTDKLAEILVRGDLLVRFITGVIIAPIIEELCFRGLVLNRLLTYTKAWAALIIQSVLFGLIHMNFPQGLKSFFCALLLGLLYIRFRQLWPCIASHAVINLFAILVSILAHYDRGISLLIAFVLGIFLVFVGVSLLLKQPAAILDKVSPGGELSDSYNHELPI